MKLNEKGKTVKERHQNRKTASEGERGRGESLERRG